MARALSVARAVRARIAAAWLGPADEHVHVGRFELRPAQRQALAAIVRAIARFGGALVADPPGTGKTVIALALATHLRESPLVVAPAALRAQWTRAASDAAIGIQFVSFEALGRGVRAHRARLVIVDEAHHARTPGTRRYANLAELCAIAKVLLLSATPVVNRAADRDALLALFLGARATALNARELAAVVIRRGDDAIRPRVRRLPDLRGASEVPGLGEMLAALPPPLPASDGRAAAALVRISLALAWRSSLAALERALRRREQRGLVIRDALAEGRWPDRATLRLWLVTDHATQLALPLEPTRAVESPDAAALRTVDAHLAAVRALRRSIGEAVSADTAARAAALVALVTAHPSVRVVCFAHHAATIRALWNALRNAPGVVAITGERVYAAAGRWTRDEVLRGLGPRAGALRPDDPRAIRLLLTTDLLAEGVELQGIGIVVHGDVAWTPARLEQRVGRAVRVGSLAREILVAGFQAPVGARPLLRLAARLARKRLVRAESLVSADDEATVARLLSPWADGSARGTATADMPARGPTTAWARGDQRCFIALLEHGSPRQRSLVCGRWRGDSWKLSTHPRVLARVIAAAGGEDAVGDPTFGSSARTALRQWERAQRVRSTLGEGTPADPSNARRTRARIARALEYVPWPARANAARAWSDALQTLASTPGIGTHHRLAALDRATSDDRAFAESLARLADERRAADVRREPPPGNRSADRARLVALLLIAPERAQPRAQLTPTPAPHSSAPKAACSETAATR